MANGRLGSVVLGPVETAKVYTNSSGSAAAVSLVAKSLSATNNASMTVKLDSADVTPQTTTVVDANSYGPDTILLDTAADYSSLYGHYKFNGNSSPIYTDTSDSSTISLENTRCSMDIIPANSSEFPWNYVPIVYSTTTYWYDINNYFSANTTDYRKMHLSSSGAFVSGQDALRSLNYNDTTIVQDIYSAGHYTVGLNSNAYMSISAYNGTNAYDADRSSNSLYYAWCRTSGATQDEQRANLFMSGGLLIAWDHLNSGNGVFTIYDKDADPQSLSSLTNIIDQDMRADCYRFRFTLAVTNAAGVVAWLAYNPTNNCNYVLMQKDANTYGYYKIDMAAATQLVGTNTSGASPTNYDTVELINSGLGFTFMEEISAPSEWSMSNSNWNRVPIKVLGNNTWVFAENDGTNWNYWKTTDLENWTKLSSTDYYSKVISSTQLFRSTDTQLEYVQSNIGSVADSGTLELGTSFNAYERTGLVLSNGDNIYIKNDSTTESIAVNVMGYEG